MSQNQASLKDDISYSEDDVNRLSTTSRLNNGWYRFKAQFPESGTNEKSGHYFVKFTCAPLTDPKDPDSTRGPTIQQRLFLPIKNKNKEGHEAPNTGGICHAALVAMLPDHPRNPRKGDDGLYYDYKGKVLADKDENAAAKEEVVRADLKKMIELYKTDGEELDGLLFYGLVGTDASGEYANIKKMSADLPEGEVLVAEADFTVQVAKKGNSAPAQEEPKVESQEPKAKRRK